MRLILVLILIYLLIRTFMNYILPYMVKGAIAEAEEQERRTRRETHISHTPDKKEGHITGGEYVDYEEIK